MQIFFLDGALSLGAPFGLDDAMRSAAKPWCRHFQASGFNLAWWRFIGMKTAAGLQYYLIYYYDMNRRAEVADMRVNHKSAQAMCHGLAVAFTSKVFMEGKITTTSSCTERAKR